MTPEAFESILTRIKGYTSYIYLHVLGEPTLHPQLAELLELSHNHQFRVNLTTNGTLLRQTGEILLASPALRQINISLHHESQADLIGVTDYLHTILSFTDSAQKKSTFINLRLWDVGKTEVLPDKDPEILQILANTFSLPQIAAENLIPGRSLTLAPGIFLSREPQFTWPNENLPEIARQGICKGLHDHIAILVDGTVVPCCLDGEGRMCLGNIHRQPLDLILTDARATRMRIGFRNQQLVEPLCQRCSYRSRFATR